MRDKYDVASWMIEQIHARGRVDGAELAVEAGDVLGAEWVITTEHGVRFSEPVLAAFRRRHAGSIRWQAGYWESLRSDKPAD